MIGLLLGISSLGNRWEDKLIERAYKYSYFLVADFNLYLNWTLNRNMIHCAKHSKSYKLIMRIHSSRGQRETLSDFSSYEISKSK